MNFFYPNFQNDFWRIFGLVFFNRPDYFLDSRTDHRDGTTVRRFNQVKITAFLRRRRFAVYDAAVEIVRGRATASDADLRVVRTLLLTETLQALPRCRKIVFTGGKAAETLWPQIAPNVPVSKIPKPGETRTFTLAGRELAVARVCSASRAYPLPLKRKAEIYRKIFLER